MNNPHTVHRERFVRAVTLPAALPEPRTPLRTAYRPEAQTAAARNQQQALRQWAFEQ